METTKQQLFEAAIKGNRKKIEELIACGVDINQQDEHGKTALMNIAQGRYDRRDLIDIFINYGAPLNLKYPSLWGATLLLEAIRGGSQTKENTHMIQHLIKHGADVNIPDDDGQTPLMAAASSGKRDICQLLLENNADVNAINQLGGTALMAAIPWGKNIVKILLEHGANINASGKDGNTALMYAAYYYGKRDVVALLLKHGADVNALTTDGHTALMDAASSSLKNKYVVKMLLEHGADVTIKNNEGKTALDLVDQRYSDNQDEIKKLLLDTQRSKDSHGNN